MSKDSMKRYIAIGLTAFGVVAASLIFFFILYRWDRISAIIAYIMGILLPFLGGVLIAYLLNPLFMLFKRGIAKMLMAVKLAKTQEKAEKRASGISSILALLVLIAAVFAIFSVIIPEVYRSVRAIIANFEGNTTNLGEWIQGALSKYPKVEEVVMPYYNRVVEELTDWVEHDMVNWLKSNAGVLVDGIQIGITKGIAAVISVLLNLFVGAIATVYLLNNKDKFIAQSRKVLYAVTGKRVANAIFRELAYAHEVFGRYIKGALADSFVLGCIVFIILTVLNIPYALLIGVLVGITNIIPFFGPYISGIPSAFLILLVSPIDALKFVVIILILQQVEGNIINPKIVGTSTGLSGFWVLFAVLFFGNIFGFFGLLFAVPMFAVIYHVISDGVNKLLKRQLLPMDTESYRSGHFYPADEEEKRLMLEIFEEAELDDGADKTDGTDRTDRTDRTDKAKDSKKETKKQRGAR